jgi:YbgC/YbaW family acyl-CoA thioester hydrolase
MPCVYTTSFGVHHCELDAFGELRASTYARLLQQAATEASTDAGFSEEWYARSGTSWVVRRTTISYLHPICASDTVWVRTWVTDFRRVRSQRNYELYVEGRDGAVAHAQTDWVYVDRPSGRLRRIPEEMIEAFMPGGTEPPLARGNLADGGAPATAFSATRTVEFRDLDAFAHVNNACYLDFIEQAAIDAAAAVGWPLERVTGLGGCWRPRLHDVEYLAEAFYGDRLRCLSWVTAQEGVDIERHGEIQRAADGAAIARARSRWAWVARATREPTEVPTKLATALASS